jgi:alkylated DNA repair protein (DNA oxidative demethylase)
MPSQLVLGLPEPAAHGGARELSAGAWLLAGLALADQSQLLLELEHVVRLAPFRHMVTPGGFRMSAAMTNCGALGWVSDESGYRYATVDPESGKPWPALPRSFRKLAGDAAAAAGFAGFEPDACLVNRYAPGARLTLHQDKNEMDYRAPIVSVSLGLPAVFLFGGETRKTRPERIPLVHGDVVVWGGPARLRFHGVAPIRDGRHELLGGFRLNLTLRKAG